MLLPQFPDQASDLDNLLRIQSDCRLIQDQDFRVAKQSLRESDTLFIAFGEVPDQTLGNRLQYQHTHGFFHTAFSLICRNALQFRREIQVFPDSHILVQWRLLRQIANTGPRFLWLFEDIMSVYDHTSFCRRQIARQNIHGCRLAGAIGTQKAVNFSFINCKVQIFYGVSIPIFPGQIPNLDHSVHLPFQTLF